VQDKPPLGHVSETAWFDALDDDLPALRAALQHLLVDEPSADGVRLAGRLGTFWYFRSRTAEGRAWAERALEHAQLADPLSAALVRFTLAQLSCGGQDDLAEPHTAAALALLDRSPHPASRTIAEVATLLAHSLLAAGAVGRAEQVGARVQTVVRSAGADPELDLLAATTATLVTSGAGRSTDDQLTALHRRALELGNVLVASLVAGTGTVAAVRAGDPVRGLYWSDRVSAHRLTLGTSDGPVAAELSALVATRASSWTSAEEDTSSSEPSSARAASPALLSMSSAIRASMVCAAMMRQAVTGSV
jgi:hypothetical protein